MKRRGSVLILALWAMAFVAFLAVTLSGRVRESIFFFKKLDDREQIRLAAEAGAKSVVDRLRVRDPGAAFSLFESDSLARLSAGQLNEASFRSEVVSFPSKDQQNQADTSASDQKLTEVDLSLQELTTTYGIMDEARKINLNLADRFLLMRLLTAVGLSDEDAADLSGQIVDYRDADDAVTVTAGVGGSEDSRYRAAGLDYGAKNADYEFVAELLRVPGMTASVYHAVRPYLTVYGDGAVNLNTVSPQVLSLLDVHPAVANKILTLRAGPDGIQGTEDDLVFGSQTELEAKLDAAFGLRLQEQTSLRHAFARRLVALNSNFFSVVSVATARQSRGQTLCVYGLRRGIQRWMEHS